MSITFSQSLFERAHGSPEYDRRIARVDAEVARTMEHRRQIAGVIGAALIGLRTIGEPEHGLGAPGCDYDDALAMLRDMMPDTSAEAEKALRDTVADKALAGECV